MQGGCQSFLRVSTVGELMDVPINCAPVVSCCSGASPRCCWAGRTAGYGCPSPGFCWSLPSLTCHQSQPSEKHRGEADRAQVLETPQWVWSTPVGRLGQRWPRSRPQHCLGSVAAPRDRTVDTQGALSSLGTQSTSAGLSFPLEQAHPPRHSRSGARPAPPGCGTKASRAKSVFCCSFVCLTVQRAIKTSHTRQSARQEKPRGRRTPKGTADPQQPLLCVQICICRLSAVRSYVQTDALASCNPRIVHEKK